mgnify:CR=1 FL=1
MKFKKLLLHKKWQAGRGSTGHIITYSKNSRIKKRIPFLNIPIVDSEILMKDKPEYILLLAWHLKKPITIWYL